MPFTLTVLLSLLLGVLASSDQACSTDSDCSLNGMCREAICHCDAGWKASDCGVLDVRPAKRTAGYNLTARGTSSWGSTIVRDPWDPGLHHLFAAEFTHGCGLDYWAPYSRIVRAESRSGPAGPYAFAAEIHGTFSHNPTVVYSPADERWLMYYIGCRVDVDAGRCLGRRLTCGPGNANNGESGISVSTSRDLRHWRPEGQVLRGQDSNTWDATVTNPSAFPLHSGHRRRCGNCHDHDTPAVLLAYRGCSYNCLGTELINMAISSAGYKGPYTKIQSQPLLENPGEDPFLWRDKRGHFHMLLHSLEPGGGFGNGPKVGRHAWVHNYTGPWTFGSKTLAFSTEVEYDDGTRVDFYRRERPQLFFSDDGEMTPLLLTTGVQPRGSPMSYSVIVPLGDQGMRFQGVKADARRAMLATPRKELTPVY
ncbi:hypothetical protein HRG_007247 [Hirsutella rhossiliensis]|uniref:EGF-like domain-containing protein n=1 Tax=Hirsutella rhossiliensis TaxID=111463 RepID=A0A9P8MVH4_9HYPO|nr:uncharacterized protein HRG_07247 [Hirsutella rhossiliensis]KAH0961169.1 hypothetical protein HRG_07247 [Hirsutella rhossiliensis]